MTGLPDRLIDHALALHDRGYACVPLFPGRKELDLAAMDMDPVHLVTRRKRLMRTAFDGVAFHVSQRPPDTADLRKWFANGNRNIGIVGGYGNLVVLDFDKPRAFEAWRQRHEALCSTTPVEQSPGGTHVFLKCTSPEAAASMHIGWRRAGHIKGYGGYVAASPSRVGDHDYVWLPGQSPYELEPQTVSTLADVHVHAAHPAKRLHDRFLGRGFMEPDGQ